MTAVFPALAITMPVQLHSVKELLAVAVGAPVLPVPAPTVVALPGVTEIFIAPENGPKANATALLIVRNQPLIAPIAATVILPVTGTRVTMFVKDVPA